MQEVIIALANLALVLVLRACQQPEVNKRVVGLTSISDGWNMEGHVA